MPSGTRTARHCRRQGNQQPGGLLISARVPISRNVYRGRTLSGGVPSGTRTATTTTAACGRNREELLGPRSDFSKPCQGAAEKSANATRTGASRQIPSRFPMRRNVYQERCRQTHSSRVFLFWWTVQDENRDKQRQGITMRAISCLLIFLTRRGILGSVQQIGS